MRWGIALGVVVVILASGVAAAGSAPYVDAGLDQEVYVGDQVYLDGAGSWDDDGDITSTEWRIETPDGRTIQPECPNCWFTYFFANQTGQYNATLTVRDSEGNVNSDMLYVTTQALEPEMQSPASESDSSSGGNGGCWVGNEGGPDNGPVDEDICDVHGRMVGIDWTDGGEGESVRAYRFENEGIVDLYSDLILNDDGTVSVPATVVQNEAEKNFLEYIDQRDTTDSIGSEKNNGGDGWTSNQPGGSTGAKKGGIVGDGCIAPCR